MKKAISSLGKIVVIFSMLITTLSVNSTCPFVTYQPLMPDNVDKLRRFKCDETK